MVEERGEKWILQLKAEKATLISERGLYLCRRRPSIPHTLSRTVFPEIWHPEGSGRSIAAGADEDSRVCRKICDWGTTGIFKTNCAIIQHLDVGKRGLHFLREYRWVKFGDTFGNRTPALICRRGRCQISEVSSLFLDEGANCLC